ncbi:MAG: hypothetical protein Kow00128_06800 [Deltaproteobacteria bacterium]
MFPIAGGLLIGVMSPFVPSAGAAPSESPRGEIRFPIFEGSGSASHAENPSSPPEIPFSTVDEVPGKSPGAVSGSWITIFEIDLQPIGAGKLKETEPAPKHPDPPNEAEMF